MSMISWLSSVSGTFDKAADWSGGVVPGEGDTALIANTASSFYTVTINTDIGLTGLMLNSRFARLLVQQSLTGQKIALTRGALVLDHGSISGTVTDSNAAFIIQSSGTLNNVTWVGNLAPEAGLKKILTVSGGLTLFDKNGVSPGTADFKDPIVLNSVSGLDHANITATSINVVNTPTLTLGSGLTARIGTIALAAGETLVSNLATGASTLGTVVGGSLVNNGVLSGTMVFDTGAFTNNGTLIVGDNHALTLSVPSIQDAGENGSIELGTGTLNLLLGTGPTSTAALDAFYADQHVTASAGHGFMFNGVIDNTGDTITLDPSSVFGTLVGTFGQTSQTETITGGSILVPSSLVSVPWSGSPPVFESLTISGTRTLTLQGVKLNNVDLSGVATANLGNNDTLTGSLTGAKAISVSGNLNLDNVDIIRSGGVTMALTQNANIYLDDAQSITDYTFLAQADDSIYVYDDETLDHATLRVAAGAELVLTLPSGFDTTQTVLGKDLSIAGEQGSTLTIAEDANDTNTTPILLEGQITTAGTFVLEGYVDGNGGESSLPGQYLNSGTIHISAGGAFIDGPDDDDGNLLTNTGMILLDSATGTLTYKTSGTGTIALSGSAASLTCNGSVAAGQLVSFGGADETVAFGQGQSQVFAGSLGGFSQGDKLTFAATTLTAARFQGQSIIATLSTGSTIALNTASALSGSLSVTNSNGIGTIMLGNTAAALADFVPCTILPATEVAQFGSDCLQTLKTDDHVQNLCFLQFHYSSL